MSGKIKHLLLAIFSLVLVVATLFIPIQARNSAEMKEAQFGYPLHFFTQDFSSFDTFHFFPRYLQFDLSGKIPSENFSVLNFFVSFLIIFLILEFLIYLLETVDFHIRKIANKNNQ